MDARGDRPLARAGPRRPVLATTADETLTEFVESTERELGEVVAEDDLNPTTCREAANAAFAMLALGRTRGVDVRVESEYVPDAISDDQR